MTKLAIEARWALGVLLSVPLVAGAATETGRVFALAPDGGDGVLVAGQRGLFRAESNGRITLRAGREGGFTALASDPANPNVLYASGQRAGLLKSGDAGETWARVSQHGPDSFAMLAIDPADSKRLTGIADGIYQSSDAGKTWKRTGDAPEKLISIAVSPTRIYAGTATGLRFSTDGGTRWQAASMYRIPTTMVSAQRNGTLYAFSWGQGFLKAREPKLAWTPLGNGFGGQAVMQLAENRGRLFAATNIGKLFVSDNGGKNWQALGGNRTPTGDAARRGAKLYVENCQACHGERGIGESPQTGASAGGLAPALDETAHAWHHTDDQLRTTILKGSPTPNSRMVGWQGRLTERDAEDLIAYVKGLWDERALRCQGPMHMSPGCGGSH